VDSGSNRFSRLWPRATLSSYLVAITLLATVPLAVLTSLEIVRGIQSERAQLDSHLQRVAASLSRNVERELSSSIEVLATLANRESLQRDDLIEFQRLLRASPMLRARWSGVFLARSDGTHVFDLSSDPAMVLPRLAIRPVGPDRDRARLPVVSDLIDEPGSGGRRVTVVQTPVLFGKELRYVLGAYIDASTWQRLVDSSGAPEGGVATLLDNQHRIIATSLAPDRHVGAQLPASMAAAMRGRASGLQHTEMLDGDEARAAWDTVTPGAWTVAIGMPVGASDRSSAVIVVTTLATAAGCMLLGVTLALLVARRVTGPLSELAEHGSSTASSERIAVIEIALLRDAMRRAASEQQIASERLQRKAEEFETLFQSSPLGLAFAQDAECRLVLQNAEMQKLLPWRPTGDASEIRLRHGGRPMPFDQQPLCRAAARGESVDALELEIRRPGQPARFVLASAVPLLDADGRTRGAVGAMMDITDRKRAESLLIRADQQIRESQNLVDLAQEAGGVGFFRYQWPDHHLTWSPGQARLFDVPASATNDARLAWQQRVDPADRMRAEQAMRQCLQERQRIGVVDYRVDLSNRSPRWLSSRVLIDYASDGQPLQAVGITVDITDQKIAERQRSERIELEQAARLKAEEENRAKDEFLAMLGHELRNPLSAIASAAEVLDRVDSAAPLAVSARNILSRQTRRLARMMDDLLEVGRVLSGKLQLTRQDANLAALVRQVLSTAEMTGELQARELVLTLDEVWAYVDATRIEQVIGNLVANAACYTPAGGQIEIYVHRESNQAVLSVRDTGVGIPAELLPRIFDLFVQGDRPLDRKAGGLGVGLTLVKRLVELHGGSVGAESSALGSRFTVRLPALAAAPTPHAPAPPQVAPASRRVLVVDDNADALSGLRSLLELDGHVVQTAGDGKTGLALLLNERPDVAVVDIGLPVFNGYEVARRARAAGHDGKLIALTGYGQIRDLESSLAAGFDAHLVKPVDPEALRQILSTVA